MCLEQKNKGHVWYAAYTCSGVLHGQDPRSARECKTDRQMEMLLLCDRITREIAAAPAQPSCKNTSSGTCGLYTT